VAISSAEIAISDHVELGVKINSKRHWYQYDIEEVWFRKVSLVVMQTEIDIENYIKSVCFRKLSVIATCSST
jgi:hypothetical protein